MIFKYLSYYTAFIILVSSWITPLCPAYTYENKSLQSHLENNKRTDSGEKRLQRLKKAEKSKTSLVVYSIGGIVPVVVVILYFVLFNKKNEWLQYIKKGDPYKIRNLIEFTDSGIRIKVKRTPQEQERFERYEKEIKEGKLEEGKDIDLKTCTSCFRSDIQDKKELIVDGVHSEHRLCLHCFKGGKNLGIKSGERKIKVDEAQDKISQMLEEQAGIKILQDHGITHGLTKYIFPHYRDNSQITNNQIVEMLSDVMEFDKSGIFLKIPAIPKKRPVFDDDEEKEKEKDCKEKKASYVHPLRKCGVCFREDITKDNQMLHDSQCSGSQCLSCFLRTKGKRCPCCSYEGPVYQLAYLYLSRLMSNPEGRDILRQCGIEQGLDREDGVVSDLLKTGKITNEQITAIVRDKEKRDEFYYGV